MKETSSRVIGAGPAGLVAAATLARAGHPVRVCERSKTVGHRFAGDFQGLENWSSPDDAMRRLERLGVRADFAHKPVNEVTFYDHRLRPTVVSAPEPLFYLVKRGPEPDTLDTSLLNQALEAGAEVKLGESADRAARGDIVAIGPRHADGLASGYVFPTELEDQAHCIISEELAPAGYAYLLVWQGRATLATCLFDSQERWRAARELTVAAFGGLVSGLDLSSARAFTGYGSVFGPTRYSDEAGRFFVGEAAGLQDPEWGFGMWFAMESGHLAARALVDEFDYSETAKARFDPVRDAALFNRVLYEHLPWRLVPWLFRKASSSANIRARLGRHWEKSFWKSQIATGLWPWVGRTRLKHRDRACHSPTCDCVWCTHGDGGEHGASHGDRCPVF